MTHTLTHMTHAHAHTDNIGVIVIDLRHIFTRDVKAYSMTPSKQMDMSAEIKQFGQGLLSNVDIFSLHDEHAGWLLKESSGGFLGRRWQKRWFVCNLITQDIFEDGSCHRAGPIQAKSYILHYHENANKALTQVWSRERVVVCVILHSPLPRKC